MARNLPSYRTSRSVVLFSLFVTQIAGSPNREVTTVYNDAAAVTSAADTPSETDGLESMPASPSDSPTQIDSPITTVFPIPADPTEYDIPSPTSTASTNETNKTLIHNDSIVNLYFLLLGVFVALLILVYWLLARRRRTRKMMMATRRHDALAADLSRRPGTGAFGRFRGQASGHESRFDADEGYGPRDEGLDARGEAPPPYLAKVPPAVIVEGRRDANEDTDIELRNIEHGAASEPPSYTPPPATASRGR